VPLAREEVSFSRARDLVHVGVADGYRRRELCVRAEAQHPPRMGPPGARMMTVSFVMALDSVIV